MAFNTEKCNEYHDVLVVAISAICITKETTKDMQSII